MQSAEDASESPSHAIHQAAGSEHWATGSEAFPGMGSPDVPGSNRGPRPATHDAKEAVTSAGAAHAAEVLLVTAALQDCFPSSALHEHRHSQHQAPLPTMATVHDPRNVLAVQPGL